MSAREWNRPVSTFTGLAAFGLLGWTWLDAVAGFVIAGFAILEGRAAREGEIAGDAGCHA